MLQLVLGVGAVFFVEEFWRNVHSVLHSLVVLCVQLAELLAAWETMTSAFTKTKLYVSLSRLLQKGFHCTTLC